MPRIYPPDIPLDGWKAVPGFSGYEAHPSGLIRLVHPPLKPSIDKDRGYPSVYIKADDGKVFRRDIHRLICATFHGPKPSPLHEVAHADGVRTNPAADNLSWKTKRENAADLTRHGTRSYGEKHPNSKLSDAQVADIKAIYAAANKRRDRYGLVRRLAAEYGVSIGNIEDLCFTRVPRPHCASGHPLSGDNLIIYPRSNRRDCRICARERARRASRKKQANKPSSEMRTPQ